jgi:uncharacterized protein YjbI with pentapeptide repeats
MRFHFQYDSKTKIITSTGSSSGGRPHIPNAVLLKQAPITSINGYYYSEAEKKAYPAQNGKKIVSGAPIDLEVIDDSHTDVPEKPIKPEVLKKISDEELISLLDAHNEWAINQNSQNGKKTGKQIFLDGYDLSFKDFSKRNLSYARFPNCDFTNANLTDTKLEYADLRQCIFNQSIFSKYTNFNYSYLEFSDLKDADLSKNNVIEANCYGASFSGVNFSECTVMGSDFRNCDFKKANLSYITRASNADFSGSDMSSCEMSYSDFSEAIFQGSSLIASKICHSNFKSTNLQEAKCYNASFEGTDLSFSTIKFASDLKLDSCNIAGMSITPQHAPSKLNFLIERLKNNKRQKIEIFKILLTTIFSILIHDNRYDFWNTLRREYTGIKFFFYMALTVFFFIPIFFKIIVFKVVEYVQHTNLIYDVIVQQNWKTIYLWEALLKTYGPVTDTLLIALLISYNAVRGYLTLSVAALHDEVIYTGISPPLKFYQKLIYCHFFIKIIMIFVLVNLAFGITNLLAAKISYPITAL